MQVNLWYHHTLAVPMSIHHQTSYERLHPSGKFTLSLGCPRAVQDGLET